jgi:hypothetical protein
MSLLKQLDEAQIAEAEAAIRNKTRLVDTVRAQLAALERPVASTIRADHLIRDRDVAILFCTSSNRLVAVDPRETLKIHTKEQPAVALTLATPRAEAPSDCSTLRTAVEVSRLAPSPAPSAGPELVYGDYVSFRFLIEDLGAVRRPVVAASNHVPVSIPLLTGAAPVFAAFGTDAAAVRSNELQFQIVHPDAALEMEHEGETVIRTVPFLLRHRATRTWLCEGAEYPTVLGHELELACTRTRAKASVFAMF